MGGLLGWMLAGFGLDGLAQPLPPFRHEPIFGLGPRTIWQGGWGIEVGVDRNRTVRADQWRLEYEVLYGLTVNWATTLVLEQPVDGAPVDVSVRTKYRFFRRDVRGGVYHAAVLGGLVLAEGAGAPEAVLLGLSAAYEGRRWLLFLTGRQRLGQRPVTRYDVALGVRPVRTGYYQPDLVVMAEVNGQLFRDPVDHRMLAAVGLWLTYRNWAFKPGIQWPLYRSRGVEPLRSRWVGSIEVHF
ncbi:hypothetical protein SAMN04488087_0901 [Rhodothermus profundi]|uniref:Uncharacterized protein n=2 Tax=Rhodothermus profundi TaxID=633813 RepID=A0A1M6RMF1_9BACT|nr:hypothetical protein SAMN04488087_0901 [Rhodothermus profundi]